jgi:hypothetical protein
MQVSVVGESVVEREKADLVVVVTGSKSGTDKVKARCPCKRKRNKVG